MAQAQENKTMEYINGMWKDSIIPTLSDYVRIPNQSPLFDSDWATNGHYDKVLALFKGWIEQLKLQRCTLEIVQEQGRTPLVYLSIEGDAKLNGDDENVLIYGHFDKQPPLTASWDQGLNPYEPVIRGNKMYGRGAADDGYSLFAALTAIKNLQVQGIPHAHYHVMIEGCEESGDEDLIFYLNKLSPRLGVLSFIVCLDSGCGNYEQFWLTSSLRGVISATLKVQVLKEGVHSGMSSGIVPDSFRVARMLLERLEDCQTGQLKLPALYCDVPQRMQDDAKTAAGLLGATVYNEFPFVSNAMPVSQDNIYEMILNKTWRPTLTVTGADGMPAIAQAGNVNRQFTALKLSVRLPPTVNGPMAGAALKELLESNPPYGATVTCTVKAAMTGWAVPALEPWLEAAVHKVSKTYWDGNDCASTGEGGSIPFMGVLREKYPNAQFCVTGLLGPGSNAHGPNEFLHLDFAPRLTCAISDLLAAHAAAKAQ